MEEIRGPWCSCTAGTQACSPKVDRPHTCRSHDSKVVLTKNQKTRSSTVLLNLTWFQTILSFYWGVVVFSNCSWFVAQMICGSDFYTFHASTKRSMGSSELMINMNRFSSHRNGWYVLHHPQHPTLVLKCKRLISRYRLNLDAKQTFPVTIGPDEWAVLESNSKSSIASGA